jgi:hypothetical protein
MPEASLGLKKDTKLNHPENKREQNGRDDCELDGRGSGRVTRYRSDKAYH